MNSTGQYGSLPVGGANPHNSGVNNNNNNIVNNSNNNNSAYASTASTLFAGAIANSTAQANAIPGVGQYGNLPGAPASTTANQYNSTLGALQQPPHGPDYGSVPGSQPMMHPGYGQVPLPPNAGVNLPAAPVAGGAFATGAAPSSSHGAYGALPVGGPAAAVSAHASEYGSTPTGRDTDAQGNASGAAVAAAAAAAAAGDQPGVSGSYGQLPTGGPPPVGAAALPPSPGGVPQRGGLMLPSLPPGAARRQPARTGSPSQVRRDPLQTGAVPLSPMRPPPTPGRAPASPAMSPARAFVPPPQQQRGGMALPPPIGGAGGNDWRGGNPNALPPAEPDEPPIGSFALDHLPPAQMDDFSRTSGGAPPAATVPSTDSDTMAALNARKLRATERANIDQQQWYFGSILRDDAAGVIANLAPGAFIVRTSSQPNSFALTFKHKSGEIQHGLLRELPQGWSIEGAPPYEVTLEALLKTHNGLNYNLVPQVRANYAQKFGGAAPAPAPVSTLVAQDEYPVPDNQLAASGGAPPPLMRRPSVTGTGAPPPRGGLSLSPAPIPRSASSSTPQRGGAALPPPLVSGKSSPNLTGAGGPQQPSSSRLCEICNQGRAVSRVKVAGQADLKLCCSNCLDMHVAAPMRAQLAERKMHVESIERQFGNKPKDKVALHQLMQLGLEISNLQEQLNAIQRK